MLVKVKTFLQTWRWRELNELTNIKNTLRNMIENRIGDIHTALPARIEKYDHETMYATVVLLNKKKLGEEMVEIPPIVEVPVAHLNANMFVIRPPYKKGDIVQVVFNEKALDKLLITGKSEKVKFTRSHKIDDAVVVSGLKLESESSLNSDYAEDLLIENQDTGSRIVMKANGDLLAETNGNSNIITTGNAMHDSAGSGDRNAGSTTTVTAPTIIADGTVHLGGSGGEGLSLGDTLKAWLDGHKHPGDSGGTTGVPTSSSPATSSKVFTN